MAVGCEKRPLTALLAQREQIALYNPIKSPAEDDIKKHINTVNALLDHVQGGLYKKLFAKQTPGKRNAPVQADDNDAKIQLRLDAGEVKDGKNQVILQVNFQAKNETLVAYRKKNGTHAKLATGTIDENTPAESQEGVARKFMENLIKKARDNLN
ncbi:uncharacterized protein BDV17DRAFT_286056 [Aspergillus undulatus]|uniref:uncharacterized protein n=1 Tax=Aspergillus undulatus TaxID=1810928 RepID=UPI003CCE1B94